MQLAISLSYMKNTKLKSCCSSAVEFRGIQDLVKEILLRLPAKSLLKFKCVSREWLALISDPGFRNSHACLQKTLKPTPNALLLNGYTTAPDEFQLVPLQDDPLSINASFFDFLGVPGLKVQDSCNGLLICSSSTSDGFFVCNPTTQEFRNLSFPHEDWVFDMNLNLAFDPMKSHHYEVIYIYAQEDANYYLDVFSSETDSWLGLHLELPYLAFDEGAFCHGAMHWYSYDHKTLWCFEVDGKILKEMPMPAMFSDDDSDESVIYFGESRGHLLMALTKKRSSFEFDVLEMESDGAGCSLTYHVNLNSIKMLFPEPTWGRTTAFSVLGIIHGETEEERLIVAYVNGKAVSYNQCDGRMDELCVLKQIPWTTADIDEAELDYGSDEDRSDDEELDYEWYNSYQYFESLVACP